LFVEARKLNPVFRVNGKHGLVLLFIDAPHDGIDVAGVMATTGTSVRSLAVVPS
jgi:hypothetical protein